MGGRAQWEGMRLPAYTAGLARANALAQVIAGSFVGALALDTAQDYALERSGLATWISAAREVAKTDSKYKYIRLPNKIVPIPASRMPTIAAHIAARQLANPNQIVLRRAPVGVNVINRARVLIGMGRPPQGMSWDEYPFASSTQGDGRQVSVVPVPIGEQWIQGGFIWGSYVLESIQPFDNFAVIVVP